jgi:hypothetical protein
VRFGARAKFEKYDEIGQKMDLVRGVPGHLKNIESQQFSAILRMMGVHERANELPPTEMERGAKAGCVREGFSEQGDYLRERHLVGNCGHDRYGVYCSFVEGLKLITGNGKLMARVRYSLAFFLLRKLEKMTVDCFSFIKQDILAV